MPIDQYNFYAWLRAKGRSEKEIKVVEDLIDFYIADTEGERLSVSEVASSRTRNPEGL
jgi:hypothetical protein